MVVYTIFFLEYAGALHIILIKRREFNLQDFRSCMVVYTIILPSVTNKLCFGDPVFKIQIYYYLL